ncbi:MAG: hypothetical protein LBU34_00705 [Planctomycetaceae bacterium]|nr:hypothetical protein [Planctomycetaceae bacterium]
MLALNAAQYRQNTVNKAQNGLIRESIGGKSHSSRQFQNAEIDFLKILVIISPSNNSCGWNLSGKAVKCLLFFLTRKVQNITKKDGKFLRKNFVP